MGLAEAGASGEDKEGERAVELPLLVVLVVAEWEEEEDSIWA